jgi:2,3,4,5-tetrahydropyridine-2-carboxylate N-succinyltransferase
MSLTHESELRQSIEQTFKTTIESIFEGKQPADDSKSIEAIESVIDALDQGKLRVASKSSQGQWQTHEWVKKAILLYFRIRKMSVAEAAGMTWVDKVPTKKWTGQEGVRVVPPAVARRGSYIESGAILMPSYVNIGAFVGQGSMVDTWATVGSCAQIGRNVHLSGGVGIGGVLEPVQASPVIIEDHVFVGSRCIVVEGAVIEDGAVLGAGVVITASTKIIDVTQAGKPVEYRGRVPRNAVVIPGTIPKEFPAGTYGVPCALIIGQRSEQTDRKTSLTSVLRDYNVSV